MNPRTLLLAAVALVLASCTSRGTPYVIAAAGPWQLAQGRSTRLGIALAIKEINDSGGINGHRLELRDADDRADPQRAADIAQRFVNDRSISAVVGLVTPAATAAATRLYDGNLVAVTAAANSPEPMVASTWLFRVASSDSADGTELAAYAGRLGHRRAAILFENDSHGRGIAGAFRRAFGGEVVSIDPIGPVAKGADVYVTYLKQRQPDLIFIAGFEASGAVLLTEARRQELKAAFMGGEGWIPLAERAEVAEGVYVGAPFVPTDPKASVQRFVTAFEQANTGVAPDANAARAYDATRVVAAALGAVGRDRRRIRDWLAGMDRAVEGVTGPIRFLPTGEPTGKGLTFTRVRKDGTLAVMEARP